VSNLGIAMAHAGQKTLIVDADLRKPVQHRVFVKTGHGKGFVDVLAGTTTLDEAIRPTEIQGLDVLESGRTVPNPSELFGSDAFWTVFEQLKSRYDQILVDSPPVGIVVDAQILAARCGLTLLVLRAQKSLRATTQRARNALSIVGARVVGAVVNDVPKRDMRYSHYGSGAYGYYYGNHHSDARNAVLKELPAHMSPQPESEASTPEKK
jgi:capsular exopolysaccharide synthesis family protein